MPVVGCADDHGVNRLIGQKVAKVVILFCAGAELVSRVGAVGAIYIADGHHFTAGLAGSGMGIVKPLAKATLFASTPDEAKLNGVVWPKATRTFGIERALRGHSLFFVPCGQACRRNGCEGAGKKLSPCLLITIEEGIHVSSSFSNYSYRVHRQESFLLLGRISCRSVSGGLVRGAPCTLIGVHGGIGAAKQPLNVHGILRIEGDADANSQGRKIGVMLLDLPHVPLHGTPQLAHDDLGSDPIGPSKYHHKLIARIARRKIVVAHMVAEDVG